MITKQDIINILLEEKIVKPESFLVEEENFIRCYNLVNFEKRYIDIDKKETIENMKEYILNYFANLKKHQEEADYNKTYHHEVDFCSRLDAIKDDKIGLALLYNFIVQAKRDYEEKGSIL
jgi:hypothetical protein